MHFKKADTPSRFNLSFINGHEQSFFFVTVTASHKKYFSELLKVNCMSVCMQITLSIGHVSAETAFHLEMPLKLCLKLPERKAISEFLYSSKKL